MANESWPLSLQNSQKVSEMSSLLPLCAVVVVTCNLVVGATCCPTISRVAFVSKKYFNVSGIRCHMSLASLPPEREEAAS